MNQLILESNPFAMGVFKVMLAFAVLMFMNFLIREIRGTFKSLQALVGIVCFVVLGFFTGYFFYNLPVIFPFLGVIVESIAALFVGFVLLWGMSRKTTVTRYVMFGIATISVVVILFRITGWSIWF